MSTPWKDDLAASGARSMPKSELGSGTTARSGRIPNRPTRVSGWAWATPGRTKFRRPLRPGVAVTGRETGDARPPPEAVTIVALPFLSVSEYPPDSVVTAAGPPV